MRKRKWTTEAIQQYLYARLKATGYEIRVSHAGSHFDLMVYENDALILWEDDHYSPLYRDYPAEGQESLDGFIGRVRNLSLDTKA